MNHECIVNLCTNVSLDETIAICADTLYCSHLSSLLSFQNPSFWNWYTSLQSMCNSVTITPCTNKLTESVWEASFEPHLQISLLGFRKQDYSKSPICHCSTDGMLMTLLWFSPSEIRRFFHTIKQLHAALTFTCEFKCNNSLPFLDVFVVPNKFGVKTLIYHKPMFTGSYTWWGSFCPPPTDAK